MICCLIMYGYNHVIAPVVPGTYAEAGPAELSFKMHNQGDQEFAIMWDRQRLPNSETRYHLHIIICFR